MADPRRVGCGTTTVMFVLSFVLLFTGVISQNGPNVYANGGVNGGGINDGQFNDAPGDKVAAQPFVVRGQRHFDPAKVAGQNGLGGNPNPDSVNMNQMNANNVRMNVNRGAAYHQKNVDGEGMGGNGFQAQFQAQGQGVPGLPNVEDEHPNLGGAPAQNMRKPVPVKIADNPACVDDVKAFCSDSSTTNNFAVLDCLQNNDKREDDVSLQCQHFIWTYKKNLTTDLRFDSAAYEVCKDEVARLPECKALERGIGEVIPCLIENKNNVTNGNCRQFLTKIASIVFSDYRLIRKFATACHNDIENHKCGRATGDYEDAPHTQGKTIECLSEHVKDLDSECKLEILRVAELQADDYHMDRPLFYACREDRERFCKRTTAGGGKVFKCLFRHKFERDMSLNCRKELVLRQQLIQEDYKVNKGLVDACQRDILENNCIRESDPGFQHARLSIVLLCLEGAMKEDGKDIAPECLAELKEVRRELMEDYKISPEIVKDCANEIQVHCSAGVHREGKTLHCLMDLARPQGGRRRTGELSATCQRRLEDLLVEVDVGENFDVDPALQMACQPVVDVACGTVKDKDHDGSVLDCLMDKIGTKVMTDDCEERLMEIQYFMARDFKLDPRLFKFCRNDASKFCQGFGHWFNPEDNTPNSGPLTFSCLYRHLKFFPNDIDKQLSRACAFEVRRVMRQRAVSVDLEPRIEEPCMTDLAALCSEDVEQGEEVECLQDHLSELRPDCRLAVGNFTQDEDADPLMDKILMKSCTPMIKLFCQDMLEDEAEPGDVMECLIQAKNNKNMNDKCAAGIEHHQLITLKDYHFSIKFKEACKNDVLENCPHVQKKGDVVECLSQSVRDAILRDSTHVVSKKCRKQLAFELLQRSENINLDPELLEPCKEDAKSLCGNVTPGKGNVIECLKKNRKRLSQTCHAKLFRRQVEEAEEPEGDYLLMQGCKRMIKKYCGDEEPSDIFKCLRSHRSDDDFDGKCKRIILERLRQKNTDYRLNPELTKSCKDDITKYCEAELKEKKVDEIEGNVLRCLRIRFSKTKRLSEDCSDHVRELVRDAQLDYQQDLQLLEACGSQINRFCTESKAADLEDSDQGRVIECLRERLINEGIKDEKCQAEVARVLAEDKADVHVDPLLYRECSMDIKYLCDDIPRGEGRQMSCLLSALEKPNVKMQDLCRKMLKNRVRMWEFAAKMAPPDNVQELSMQVATSPSKLDFAGVYFAVIGVIFIGGFLYGRVTKRARTADKLLTIEVNRATNLMNGPIDMIPTVKLLQF